MTWARPFENRRVMDESESSTGLPRGFLQRSGCQQGVVEFQHTQATTPLPL
ncbi:MAG: hypothetical protein HOM68_13515 [Gemmatimonadetes bacterium]|nr:hypothetical protein [Gemmatimonadota bacterium]MBT4610846.1 hypothetical protein [Gemmatimonadota bacterium]MBT5057555.1 hypothetical protein [Gemmatimonadota bacterium]MBT5146290.1 hypothetical protein [Gemmatimonadota bacterium]MBT5591213.1 hypothetical protein [Gemmatimonadota bacterium]